MNADKIAAHHERWEDLPYMAHPPGMDTTKYDGELQELGELGDVLLDGIESLCKLMGPHYAPLEMLTHGAVEWPNLKLGAVANPPWKPTSQTGRRGVNTSPHLSQSGCNPLPHKSLCATTRV